MADNMEVKETVAWCFIVASIFCMFLYTATQEQKQIKM